MKGEEGKERERERGRSRYRVSAKGSCSRKSETFPGHFSDFGENRNKLFSWCFEYKARSPEFEHKRRLSINRAELVSPCHFFPLPFCSQRLTYVQRISRKNVGWSIIGAMQSVSYPMVRSIGARFLTYAAQTQAMWVKTYRSWKSNEMLRLFDADVSFV